ncbi:hypothetical protein AURDEDRAFT_169748 [Auricularia subglabra TFB-10046 SS5]|nr:hypothetical protein AURDEDRAFT_169748 [Auricularia subglabra TFB-10046 SS5]
MELTAFPKAVACQIRMHDGSKCGRKTRWVRLTRSEQKLSFLVAICDDHTVVAVFCSVDGLKWFYWAKTNFERSLKIAVGRGSERAKCLAERCTQCLAKMNGRCTNWLCKKCCTGVNAECALKNHRTEQPRPWNPIVRIRDFVWYGDDAEPPAPGEREPIDVDADPEVIVIDEDDDDDAGAREGSHAARDDDEEQDIARTIALSLLPAAINDDEAWASEDSHTARDDDEDMARAVELSLLPTRGETAPQDFFDDDDPYVEDEDLSRALRLSRWVARMKAANGAGPSRSAGPDEESDTLQILVTCEHLWEENAVRDSGNAIYRTTVTIPASRGEEGDFFESDFTDKALTALRLNRKALKRVLVWDNSREHYLLAYPEEDDDPTDACFALEVKYSLKHRITFLMKTKVEELGAHVELKEEEKRHDEPCEWDSLRGLLIRVEAQHFEKKSQCQGKLVTRMADCYAQRRRFYPEDCVITLSDFCENDLMALELADADLSVADDGEYRYGRITMHTPLNTTPASKKDDHKLNLVIRVHGSKTAAPKRRRATSSGGKQKGKEEEEEEEDGRDRKRHKTY